MARKSPPPPPEGGVLIVRPSALGDVSRTVPVLATLRSAWPKARIEWLVAEAFADVVRHHPMLDGVVTFPRARLAGFGWRLSATREGLALANRLRRGGYEVVYDFQGLFRSGLLTWLTRAPRRVGLAQAREWGWLGYNVRHHVNGCTHTVDVMLGLLEAEGFTPERDMRLYVGEQDLAWLARFRQESGIGDAAYACVAPTARWGCKCWPLERYAQIAQRLLESELAGSHVVVLASPSEQAQVTPLLRMLPAAMRQRVHLPHTSVGQLMAILSQAQLLVCNDSAALHIAVGLDRPVVAIFGPTDPARVGPYRRLDAVVHPPQAARDSFNFNYRRHLHDPTLISQVSVEAVWQKVQEQLQADR